MSLPIGTTFLCGDVLVEVQSSPSSTTMVDYRWRGSRRGWMEAMAPNARMLQWWRQRD